jgi:hypothetical protein
MLRRAAVTLTTLGLAIGLTAAPAVAHEGHHHGSPGQNKATFALQCPGVGELTIEVTAVGQGRGVGRIVEGGKGVLIPTVATFEIRNAATGAVLSQETEEFAPGQRKMATTTCTGEFFRGTVAEVAEFDPDFAAELRDMGLADTDVVVAGISVDVLLRGPIARSGR